MLILVQRAVVGRGVERGTLSEIQAAGLTQLPKSLRGTEINMVDKSNKWKETAR